MEGTCHVVGPGLFFFSCYRMCSHCCKAQRPVQAFIKTKIKLCTVNSFPVLHRFSLSCPASSCINWQNNKGMRLRHRVICCVVRRYNQLRGH